MKEYGLNEGWLLSERDDGFMQIQKDDRETTFATDADAFAFVQTRADAGSNDHQLAVFVHGKPRCVLDPELF